jgi:hypothetical protein
LVLQFPRLTPRRRAWMFADSKNDVPLLKLRNRICQLDGEDAIGPP